jgi:hypothetical protein
MCGTPTAPTAAPQPTLTQKTFWLQLQLQLLLLFLLRILLVKFLVLLLLLLLGKQLCQWRELIMLQHKIRAIRQPGSSSSSSSTGCS